MFARLALLMQVELSIIAKRVVEILMAFLPVSIMTQMVMIYLIIQTLILMVMALEMKMTLIAMVMEKMTQSTTLVKVIIKAALVVFHLMIVEQFKNSSKYVLKMKKQTRKSMKPMLKQISSQLRVQSHFGKVNMKMVLRAYFLKK